jgi:hypothetical protein
MDIVSETLWMDDGQNPEKQKFWAHLSSFQNVDVVSIPDQVTGFFNWPNPSCSTEALESTQPLTELRTGDLPEDKGRPAAV